MQRLWDMVGRKEKEGAKERLAKLHTEMTMRQAERLQYARHSALGSIGRPRWDDFAPRQHLELSPSAAPQRAVLVAESASRRARGAG